MPHRSQLPQILAVLSIVALAGCRSGPHPDKPAALEAAARPAAIVDVTDVVENLELDIRYAGTDNFVGEAIDGYLAAKCLVHTEAAARLKKAQEQAEAEGLRLKIFDCYRPQRAVDHFLRWAANPDDIKTKAAYYPNKHKPELIGPYIAARSGHSRAAAIDLTLVKKDRQGGWTKLDMGTPFDFFDARSNTDDPRITPGQKANRYRLRAIMLDAGFKPYDLEWWHFSIADEPYPATFFDFPVQ
ncbi:MAG: M15 family metallopeptidase [Pseudomonadota bacterium]